MPHRLISKASHGDHKRKKTLKALWKGAPRKQRGRMRRFLENELKRLGRYRGGPTKASYYEYWTRDNLRAEAKRRGIPGRGRMNKAELVEALAR